MLGASSFHNRTPFIFLIYINDLQIAIMFSEVDQVGDDTYLINWNSCVKPIRSKLMRPKNLTNWLKLNKISLNVGKTELEFLTSIKKQLGSDLKIKLNRRRLREKDSVSGRYLEIQINKILTWKQQINHVAVKLCKANAMLPKLRHALNKKPFWVQSTMHATFDSCLLYASFARAQILIQLKTSFISEKIHQVKVLQRWNSRTNPLFKDSKIPKRFITTCLQ